MPPTRPFAGVIAHAERRKGGKLATGPRSRFVDRTAHAGADFAFERDAARRPIVGTAHANQRIGQSMRQRLGHAGTVVGSEFGAMKIDPIGGAARAAGKTGGIGHNGSGQAKGRLSLSRGERANSRPPGLVLVHNRKTALFPADTPNVTLRPLLLRLLLAFALLFSQTAAMVHAFEHVGPATASSSKHAPLPGDKVCLECLAFLTIGSALPGSAATLPPIATEVDVPPAQPFHAHRPVLARAFDSRAPPVIQ